MLGSLGPSSRKSIAFYRRIDSSGLTRYYIRAKGEMLRNHRTFAEVRLVVIAMVIGCVGASGQSTNEPKQSAPGCAVAQVLAINAVSGKWVANPGKRELHQWSCVVTGDEIVMSGRQRIGEITIIYRSGSKSPHTERCAKSKDCRNAYRIEQVTAPSNPDSDSIIDQFFKKQDPKVVPGILHGFLLQPNPEDGRNDRPIGTVFAVGVTGGLVLNAQKRPKKELLVQPTVICDNDGTVDLSSWWPTAAAYANVSSKPIGMENGESHSSLHWTLKQPLDTPVLYQVTAARSSLSPKSVALVAPQNSCTTSMESFQRAVEFTHSWPSDTPRAAIWNFQMGVLFDLSTTPKTK